MKKNIYIISALLLALGTTSCDEYLDVTSDEVAKEENLFEMKSGFSDALTGAYMKMAEAEAYGENLTMYGPDALADVWYVGSTGTGYVDVTKRRDELEEHSYESEYAKAFIEEVYSQLFSTILQDNIILKNLDETSVQMTTQFKSIVEAEARAMRAFCQFDVLRLFGQMPSGSNSIQLPYNETCSIHEIPAYYSYNDYVNKLLTDVTTAENLLKQYDPIMGYSLSDLNSTTITQDDSYYYYRQSRFNYWAVRALHARIALYTGDTSSAYTIAKEIINATAEDGDPVISLSGSTDLNPSGDVDPYRTLPRECLLYLSSTETLDRSATVFGTKASQINAYNYCCLDINRYNELFAGQEISSNNRYQKWWNNTTVDSQGRSLPSMIKYYWDTDKAGTLSAMTYRQIIPLIRMSEVYLIAIESTTDLAEANSLYTTYMRSHNVLLESDKFASLTEVKNEMPDEYLREFIGEGQSFFTYKRLGAETFKWGSSTNDNSVYCLPLPDSEYNPNSK